VGEADLEEVLSVGEADLEEVLSVGEADLEEVLSNPLSTDRRLIPTREAGACSAWART